MQVLPLSKAQLRIWLEWKAMPNSSAYNNPLLYQLFGDVNPDLIRQALQFVVDTQPALRCYFIEQHGTPQQILLSELKVNLNYHDLSNSLHQDKEILAKQIIANNVEVSFSLDQTPLFRFTLIKIAAAEYYFILNIHHIVVDGSSANMLVKTISDFYNRTIVRTEKNDKAYIEYLTCSAFSQSKEKDFWANQFKDANFIVDLYTESVLGYSNDNKGAQKIFSISPTLTRQLKKLAKHAKTTDFILLLSIFYIVLAKYANQYDLTIGYAIDIRSINMKNLFGFFVNTIPLRFIFSAENTFADVIEKLTQQRKLIKKNQLLDYSDIIKSVRGVYPETPSTLFNISFIRANFALSGLNLFGIKVIALPVFTGSVKDDLCLLYDETDKFEFKIEYKKK